MKIKTNDYVLCTGQYYQRFENFVGRVAEIKSEKHEDISLEDSTLYRVVFDEPVFPYSESEPVDSFWTIEDDLRVIGKASVE